MSGVLTVPYGLDRLPAGDAREDGLRSVVITDMQKGLRFNNAFVEKVFDEGGDFAKLERWTVSLCGVWETAARRTVSHYFRAVEEAIERKREELAARLARYEGLFGHLDYRFSAPRPLPRAHLPVPMAEQGTRAIEDFIRVDIAFFPGASRTIAFLSRATGIPTNVRQKAERLEAAGIEVCWVEDFTSPAFFETVLVPEAGRTFLDGEDLPCGLLRHPIAA